MKSRKILAGFLLTILVLSSSVSAFAAEQENLTGDVEIIPIKADLEKKEFIRYKFFTGVVKEIEERKVNANLKFVSVEDSNGRPATIVISDSTHIAEDAKVSVGATLTAFYDSTKPMIMIYPPQYSAEAIIIEEDVAFDFFTGRVKDIREHDEMENYKFVSVEDMNGEPATIVVSADTHIFEEGDIEVEAIITAYFDRNKPMTKIYPPKYRAEVIAIEKEAPKIKYNHIIGKVNDIRDRDDEGKSKLVSIENEEMGPANIIISEDTYILDDKGITVGTTIKVYYDATKPMILIYPPQYNAEVVVVVENEEDHNVKFDIFDKNLVSIDNTLKLNISKETEIILKDGTDFEGELADNKLVVIYGVSTKSIPAQTTPYKIVVLSETKEETPILDVSDMDIIVENKIIKAPNAYTSGQGAVMVPLRPVAEELGYKVVWNGELGSVTLGQYISLKPGDDNYVSRDGEIIPLEYAPSLVDGNMFVPLNFFREVMGLNNAYVFEGQIVIDNGEKME